MSQPAAAAASTIARWWTDETAISTASTPGAPMASSGSANDAAPPISSASRAGRRAVDVTDGHDPQLGRARGDEPGMVAAHPPGADERQPDPRRQWISSIRTDLASCSDVVAAIAMRVAS